MGLHVYKTAPIPEEFYSSDTGKMFDQCLICHTSLLSGEDIYFIEKAIRQYQSYETQTVIFEYAMCMECALTLRNEMSKDSLAKLETFFLKKGNLKRRWSELTQRDEINVQDWISQCVITGAPQETCNEYQLVAQCDGDQIILTSFPYLIGDQAMNEISDLMSNQTLGEIDRFIDKYFSGPPEFKELFKQGKFAII